MKILILDDAQDDLIEGYRFYERQSAGLGVYFLDSLNADIDSLNFYAGIHPKYRGYHRQLSKRFPYAIYYRMQKNIVHIHAVLDCRRDPEWINKRLK